MFNSFRLELEEYIIKFTIWLSFFTPMLNAHIRDALASSIRYAHSIAFAA